MKKQYYIHYYRDFSNTFSLVWADTPGDIAALESEGWERITRKRALEKCRGESWARTYDSACSGYGSVDIIPAEWYLTHDPGTDFFSGRGYELIGRIWERRR